MTAGQIETAELAAPVFEKPAPPVGRRLPQLDGLRGIAILLVLICHYIPDQIHAEQKTALAYLQKLLQMTWCGVDLFFVLSGFLIAGILLDNCKAGNYFKVFYIRRACRIFPLYFSWLGLFIAVRWSFPRVVSACAGLFDHPMPLWTYAAFIQNYWIAGLQGGGARWLAMTWSLAVEEQFYLVLPVIIFCLSRRALPWCFGLMILAAPVLRLSLHNGWAFVATPCRADSLLAGALLAYALRSGGVRPFCRKNLALLHAIFAVLLAGVGYMVWRGSGMVGGALTHTWLAALFSLALMLALVHENGWYVECLSNPILAWFGTVSYGLYLFHQAVNGLLHGLICGTGPRLQTIEDAAVTLLALVVTLTLAGLSFFFVERRIIQYGHSFKYQGPASSVG